MQANLIKAIKKANGKIEMYKAPIKAISDSFSSPCSRGCTRNLKVAILAAPCHGFGDVIFAAKFAGYLKKGLGRGSRGLSNNVTIITSTPELFKNLGVKGIPIVGLNGVRGQCRRFSGYTRPTGLKQFDLIFVAPLMADFKVNYLDVKKLFKESTPFNTIFLSEYQSPLKNGYDFPTGIGKGYFGMLFDDLKPNKKLKVLGTIPYVFGYAAKDAGPVNCVIDFAKMVVAKYHKQHKKLQLVLPDWAAEEVADSLAFERHVKKYYPNVTLKLENDTEEILVGRGNTLIIRGDILPVQRPDMLSLIKYSQKDLLMTGDQSLTDAIDCCRDKIIWYQTVAWKKDLARALSKELPQKFIGSTAATCGTLRAVGWSYRRNLNFKRDNDFRRLAKHKLESIFRAASEAKKKNSIVNRYLQQLDKSKSKKNLLLNFQE